jgi:chromosome segregation ATPase
MKWILIIFLSIGFLPVYAQVEFSNVYISCENDFVTNIISYYECGQGAVQSSGGSGGGSGTVQKQVITYDDEDYKKALEDALKEVKEAYEKENGKNIFLLDEVLRLNMEINRLEETLDSLVKKINIIINEFSSKFIIHFAYTETDKNREMIQKIMDEYNHYKQLREENEKLEQQIVDLQSIKEKLESDIKQTQQELASWEEKLKESVEQVKEKTKDLVDEGKRMFDDFFK